MQRHTARASSMQQAGERASTSARASERSSDLAMEKVLLQEPHSVGAEERSAAAVLQARQFPATFSSQRHPAERPDAETAQEVVRVEDPARKVGRRFFSPTPRRCRGPSLCCLPSSKSPALLFWGRPLLIEIAPIEVPFETIPSALGRRVACTKRRRRVMLRRSAVEQVRSDHDRIPWRNGTARRVPWRVP